MTDTSVALRPKPLAFLPLRLFRPERAVSYVLVAWALTISGSLVLAPLARWLVGGPNPELPELGPWLTFLSLVVYAPVVETLIMGALLLLLERFAGFLPAVLISSVGWGVAHSLQAPAWGVVIWWPFLIFSIAFLTWRRRNLALAFGMPMVMHALQNLGPALLLLLGIEG